MAGHKQGEKFPFVNAAFIAIVVIGAVWLAIDATNGGGDVKIPDAKPPAPPPPPAPVVEAPAPATNPDAAPTAAGTQPGTTAPTVENPTKPAPAADNSPSEAPPPNETVEQKAERLEGVAKAEQTQADDAMDKYKKAQAAADAATGDQKAALQAEADKLRAIADKEAADVEVAKKNLAQAEADLKAENEAKAEAAAKKAVEEKAAAIKKEFADHPVVEEIKNGGQGLISLTRDGLESMVKQGLLTQEMVDSITNPELKAVYQAALTGTHDQLTGAIENLYKATGHYVPGAAGESTILQPGDSIRIDEQGVRIIRAGGGEVSIVTNEGLVQRPADVPMSPPVQPVKVEVPVAPATTETPAHEDGSATAPVPEGDGGHGDPVAPDQKSTEPHADNNKSDGETNHSSAASIIDAAAASTNFGKKP